MSIKIEFHILQSFPPSSLNRDDSNMPKDCEFGGVRRARISSQCIKRAVRLHPDFVKQTGLSTADRTRRMIAPIQARLVEAGKNPEAALEAASNFVGALLGKLEKKKDSEDYPRSKVMFYVSEEEIKTISTAIMDNWNLLGDKTIWGRMIKSYIQLFEKRTSAPDIALFGRMLAADPGLNLEASCQMAHAISTHRVNMEFDFFSAVDDLQTSEEIDPGMVGIAGFNAATFYRYAAIDWGQLLTNLDGDIELARKTLSGFAYALAKAVPTGKQNAFAAQTPPSMILAVIRKDGQAWSLANAFENPVRSDRQHSILQNSISALEQHWQNLDRVYGDPDQPVTAITLLLDPGNKLETLKDSQANSLIELVNKLCSALPRE